MSEKTKYLSAVALSLVVADRYNEMVANAAIAERDLASCPPIINLLVRTQQADRLVSTQAHVAMLDAARDVTAGLQAIAKGDPAQAHAGVLALLETMGMPVEGCACCGSLVHKSDSASVAEFVDASSPSVHAPGSSRIN